VNRSAAERARFWAEVDAGIRPRPQRHAVVGRRVDPSKGDEDSCTVLIIRELDRWVLYPHGVAGLAVELSRPDAETLAHGILGTTPDPHTARGGRGAGHRDDS